MLTYEMADMNKSHFATMLDEFREEHAATLRAQTEEARVKLETMMEDNAKMADQARRDVERAKAETEVSTLVGRD
jgi:hypothetical protein